MISPSWVGVHTRLRDACRAERDEAGELYYALAVGELEFVTWRLHERLADLADVAWFELVESVTAAPHRYRRQDALIDEVRTLVREAALEQPLTSLGCARMDAAPYYCTPRAGTARKPSGGADDA
jgi:hypothetical protein